MGPSRQLKCGKPGAQWVNGSHQRPENRNVVKTVGLQTLGKYLSRSPKQRWCSIPEELFLLRLACTLCTKGRALLLQKGIWLAGSNNF